MIRQQQSICDSEGFNIPQEIAKIAEEIFRRLPLKCISRAKVVCKAWNALLSSTVFNPNDPWLMLCIDHPAFLNILFSLSTNIGKTIPIDFMPRYKTGVKYYASSRGILLVGIGVYPQALFVCDPLIKQFRQLPPTLSIQVSSFIPKGIVFCQEQDQVFYKVVAIGPDHSKSKKVVEIYTSSNSSWTTAGEIPLDFTLRKEIVFWQTRFFCLVSHPKNLMLYCSINEDACKKIKYVRLPVPVPDGHTTGHYIYSLVALGASFLLTSAIKDNYILSDVRIWEFQIDHNAEDGPADSDSSWREIARMPESICWEFGRHGYWYECVGEGDFACFRNGGSEKVVTYNLREGSWKWLPPSPCRWMENVHTIAGFTPRPDVKP